MNGQVPSRIAGHAMPEVVLRTRRSVMEAAEQMQEQRRRQWRQVGFAVLALGALVVVSLPALWSAYTDLDGGERFTDMPMMLLVLSLVLLSAIFGVLLVSWRSRSRNARDGER